jgi:hypothetical protein
MKLRIALTLIALGLVPGCAIGQDNEADEGYAPEIEAGPAFDRDIHNQSTTYGASIGAEATVIQQWLELEADVTRLTGAGRSELGFEFLLKKPFTLSQNTELMLGLGPEVVRTTVNGVRTTPHSAEYLLDFQFWQTRNIGLYVEPGYGVGLGNSRGEHSFNASVGILLRW